MARESWRIIYIFFVGNYVNGMKKNVYYVNVLRIDKDVKIDVRDVLKRLDSISTIVRDINELSKMVKKDVKKTK